MSCSQNSGNFFKIRIHSHKISFLQVFFLTAHQHYKSTWQCSLTSDYTAGTMLFATLWFSNLLRPNSSIFLNQCYTSPYWSSWCHTFGSRPSPARVKIIERAMFLSAADQRRFIWTMSLTNGVFRMRKPASSMPEMKANKPQSNIWLQDKSLSCILNTDTIWCISKRQQNNSWSVSLALF